MDTPEAGMTLHQWFAGMALSVLANPVNKYDCTTNAKWALEMADAMIAAYEKRGEI